MNSIPDTQETQITEHLHPLSSQTHREQKPLGPLKGAHKRIRLIRRLLHIFGKNQHREDLIKALANLQ